MIEKFTQICPTLSSNLSNLINQKKLNFGGIAISITIQNAHLLMGQHFISYFRLYLHLGKLKETQFRKLCDRVSPLSLFSKAPAFGPRSKEGFAYKPQTALGLVLCKLQVVKVPDTCCFLSGSGEWMQQISLRQHGFVFQLKGQISKSVCKLRSSRGSLSMREI